MDRRKAKTVKAIKQAFSRLISEKRYSEITVQDIIDEADIGRSTFYEHFKTKDEILVSLCSDIFKHVFSYELTPEKYHNFSNTNDYKHIVEHTLHHFGEDKATLKGILGSEGKDVFMRDIRQHLNELIRNYLLTVYPCDKFPEDLLINHLITSLIEITIWWLDRDCKETPEEIAAYYLDLIIPVLKA